jgi:hypothetical protein
MFKLSDLFISQYEGKQPNWGFGDLSYFVYKRTYAREKDNGQQEEYWETCQRVVEGVFNIQFKHCKRIGLEWNPQKAQATAQKMFTKMWEFKFLPPGRGLWIMGTSVVDKIGSASLQNCGFISTRDIHRDFAMPFVWTTDMMMLGVGVGFDTKGAGKATVYEPQDVLTTEQAPVKGAGPDSRLVIGDVYDIPDTREGWVEALKRLLESYSKPNQTKVLFCYDNIRKAGEPIKGFGGIACGPEPLKKGIESIRKLLDARVGNTLTSVDITDIMNFIGKFVVSGNVRRGAEIAIGEEDDSDFIRMKDPELYKAELNDRRWASNNSIFVTPDSDFSNVIKSVAKNGEPGFIFLNNARHYGRLKDGWRSETSSKFDDVDGFNPCQPEFATILTKDGLRTMGDIEIGDEIWSREGWTKVLNKWSTGVKPVFNHYTTGGVFTGTANHRVETPEGKQEVRHADKVLTIAGVDHTDLVAPLANYVADGVFFGDGYYKKQQNRNKQYPVLIIGKDDKDYFKSELVEFLGNRFQRDGSCDHLQVSTSITVEEKVKSYELSIPQRMFKNPSRLSSFLRGLYTADGSVINQGSNSVRVTYKTASRQLGRDVQLALSILGIRSYITTNKAKVVSFKNGDYECKESYDVNITKDIERFYNIIGFIQQYKMDKIKVCLDAGYCPNDRPTFTNKQETEYLGDYEVFDITVDNSSHTYWTGGLSVSNCGEQGLRHGELCCLVETFPANHESAEEYHETLKFAFMYAKTVTLVPTHNQLTNQVMLSNRRIGLSMSGVQQALKKFGFAEFFGDFCDKGYDVVRHWDRIYSRWLGIPTSIKVTTVKPSGTVSLLAGATPGVHCTHSKYYLRTFRISAKHPLVNKLINAGYRIELAATDQEIYEAAGGSSADWERDMKDGLTGETLEAFGDHGGSLVVYFPVEEKNFTKSKFDISLWEQLSLARELQDKWSDNSVSITVTFRPEEVRDLKSAIEYLASYVKTLSFLPLKDHSYSQAPYQECSEEDYKEYSKDLKKLRLTSLRGGKAQGERYCNNDTCEI